MQFMGEGGVRLAADRGPVFKIDVPFQVGALGGEAWIHQVEGFHDQFLGQSLLLECCSALYTLNVVTGKSSIARLTRAVQFQLGTSLKISDRDEGCLVFADRPGLAAAEDWIKTEIAPECQAMSSP